ncbi:MAG: magnesium transporter CorA family protein [Ignavibacteriales bacterium]|nr:magnesium transporter CorA family protein [Ignavibacteriales bacterium]
MIKRFEILDDKVVETKDVQSPIFLYIIPDDNEKRELIDKYKIDEHTLNSSLDPDELSRLEFEPDHIAIIFKRPENYIDKSQLLLKVSSMGVFLFKERAIIVIPKDIVLFDAKVFLKVSTLNDLVLRLLNRAINHYFAHINAINMISDELESKINMAMENKYLINLFTLEKSLVYYLNSINSNGVLLDKLKISAAKIGFTQTELELLEDILIDNNQCYRQAEISSNILASLMDARASIVGNNLNVLMKTLNIITIGIMVPTFVVSAFSMNVGIPLQQHPFAFYIIMGLALCSVSLVIFLWRKKKW